MAHQEDEEGTQSLGTSAVLCCGHFPECKGPRPWPHILEKPNDGECGWRGTWKVKVEEGEKEDDDGGEGEEGVVVEETV